MSNKTRNLDAQANIQDQFLQFSCATETPYLRYDDGQPYYEVLVISEDSLSFERLIDDRAPLLYEHDPQKAIGVVKKAYIKDKKLYVKVKFSNSEFAQRMKQQMMSDLRRNVSIGYTISHMTRNGDIDGIPVYYVDDFQIYEVSTVSCAADVTCGVKRSKDLKDFQNMKKFKKNLEQTQEEIKELEATQEEIADETKAEETEEVVEQVVEETTETVEDIPTEEEKEITEEQIVEETKEEVISEQEEIKAAGQLAGEEELAEECIKNKRSLAEFKSLLKKKRSMKNIKKENTMEKFSISKAIRNACSQYKKDVSEEFQTKVINENKRKLNIGEEADIVLTKKELTRALAPTATNGAELVATDYLPQEFTPVARPKLTLEATGYYSIPVEGNSVSFAVVTSGATAGMYDLDGELADGDMHFANRTLTPHKAGVCIPIPYSLILQARPEIDNIVQDDIVKALDEIRDNQILVGSGLSGQVTGIANTEGVNTLSAAASALYSWQGVLTMEQEIRDANEFGQLCFVMNSNDYKTFASTLKDEVNSYAGWILEDGKIKDYPVFVNNNLSDGQIILGDFSQVVVADFDGLMIKVDDITYIKRQAIQLVATRAFDVCVRRPKAFTVTTIA